MQVLFHANDDELHVFCCFQLDREKSDLHTRVISLREMTANLEEQLKTTSSSLRNSRETIADKEAEISKLRLLLEQSERSADELRRRLESKMAELQRCDSDKLNAEEHQGLNPCDDCNLH